MGMSSWKALRVTLSASWKLGIVFQLPSFSFMVLYWTKSYIMCKYSKSYVSYEYLVHKSSTLNLIHNLLSSMLEYNEWWFLEKLCRKLCPNRGTRSEHVWCKEQTVHASLVLMAHRCFRCALHFKWSHLKCV